jgi:dipeptidyl-peptidase-4
MTHRIRTRLLLFALLLLLPLAAPPSRAADAPRALSAEKKPVTVERITAEPPLVPRGLTGLAWRDGSHATWVRTEGRGPDAKSTLVEIDAATGKISELTGPIFPPEEPAATEARKPLSLGGSQWSPKGDALLLNSGNDLWLFTPAGHGPGDPAAALRRLTRDADEEEAATFSPDGRKVAFVRKNDLWVVDIASGKETRLTTTGSGSVLNGLLDWVYGEELAGRRSSRSYEWAPDSSAIAYLRLDQTRVPEFPIVDFLPLHGEVRLQRYPKAGDPNAVPSLHVVSLGGAETAVARPVPDDVYVGPEMSWTPDSSAVAWVHMNRAQNRVEFRLLPRGGGPSRTILSEEDPAWINSIEPPRFLRDGSFLFLSERSGFLHLWRGRTDGSSPEPVTSGSWMIDRTWAVDEAARVVLYNATEKDPRERHVYRSRLDGTGRTRLTKGRGVHLPVFSPGATSFADTFSDVDTPPATAVVRSDGTVLATVHAAKGEWAAYRLASTEFRSFRTADGTWLHARLVRPADFDPARRYPVVVSVYGGPHAQVVQDRWGATSLFDHLLAEKGFLVWSVDNRGSWGRGHAFEAPLLGRLGETELKDQVAGVAELRKLPFVDGSRIGIFGWSYGGTLALYAATHAGETFRCAVAGAPVTDWKLYDSIYTERYLKLPSVNAAGYRDSSPLAAAGQLVSKLLVLHGTSDDNVHLQQTVAFVDALARARKDYSLVLLPGQKHGPRDPAARLYTNQRVLEFFQNNL